MAANIGSGLMDGHGAADEPDSLAPFTGPRDAPSRFGSVLYSGAFLAKKSGNMRSYKSIGVYP
jgi:hypothetical protein